MTTRAYYQGRELGVPVFESEHLQIGQMLKMPTGIAMHPLDLIAMQHPNVFDRLDAALAWILKQANARLDLICKTTDAIHCVHCGEELGEDIGEGLFSHANSLQRCQSSSVPYGHMGHPSMPCPPGDINPCSGYREDTCTHHEEAMA